MAASDVGVCGGKSVGRRVCESPEEFEAVQAELKMTACPHCQRVGTLIRHGYLRGYDQQHQRKKTIRAWRIYCNNRRRSIGCGRTFSIWYADKIKRLFLTAQDLWAFLKQALLTSNKRQAFQELNSGLSDSAPYRIWKRFRTAQSTIRTALDRLCPPPPSTAERAEELTLAHLEAAFSDHRCPIVAYQARLQTFFI